MTLKCVLNLFAAKESAIKHYFQKPWLISLLLLASVNAYCINTNAYPYSKLTTEVINNEGFVLGWSNQHLVPLWVIYSLKKPWRFQLTRRPRYFNADKRTRRSASSWDYSGSSYDRGHLAPNYAITRSFGKKAQQQTFLTSNAAPMKKRLNRKLWQRIEEAITRFILPRHKQLTIITGPILGKNPKKLAKKISVPKAFYKIIVDRNRQHALVFIVPQNVKGSEPLKKFVSTINEVEKQTGLDFFLQLSRSQETRLEKYHNPQYWRLDQYNLLPARY